MESSKITPQVRIEKIHLKDFKGVSDGTIEFNCLKNPFEKDIQADILGLYGQNGSGKTTFLEALHIAKLLMMGRRIPENKFKNIVSQGAEYARMEISFQFINQDDSLFHVQYAFSLGYTEIGSRKLLIEILRRNDSEKNDFPVVSTATAAIASALLTAPISIPFSIASAATSAAVRSLKALQDKKNSNLDSDYEHFIRQFTVFDEVVSLSGCFNGEEYRYGPIFDASSSAEDSVFLPKAKHQEFFPYQTSSAIKELAKFKDRAISESRSFIFSDDVRQLILEQLLSGAESVFAKLIWSLREHATQNIRVLDSIVIGASRDNIIPLYTAKRGVGIRLDDSSTFVDAEGLETLQTSIAGLNIILEQLIPGLTIKAVKQVDCDETGKTESSAQGGMKYTVYSVRNNVRIPLTQESTGILHLISSIGLISYAFSNPSVTVAIDEIDSGVYEYLLGELLLIFEEYGSGQLIFTCHNLRPMEVLNKKFVCFTTTNPSNRYLRLKNIRKENNLRDVYLRELVGGDQPEELYSSAKHGKIASALQKAGEILA